MYPSSATLPLQATDLYVSSAGASASVELTESPRFSMPLMCCCNSFELPCRACTMQQPFVDTAQEKECAWYNQVTSRKSHGWLVQSHDQDHPIHKVLL